jgi:hypothetical protein
MRRAEALLARVHAKGFRCAIIENEGHTREVAVIALRNYSAALRIVRAARRLKLAAHVAVS